MTRILVTRQIPENGLELLRSAGFALDIWQGSLPPTRSTLLGRVKGVDGILSMLSDQIDAELMEVAGSQLKVISNFAVGTNNIDMTEARARNIKIGNTPDVLTDATADLAMGLLLATARQFRAAIQTVTDNRWKTWEPLGHIGCDLVGKTLGIFGMGRIGASVARRAARGWNMKILYTSRSPHPELCDGFQAERVDFDHLLKNVDFLSVHAPLTAETHRIFDENAFAKMKSTAVFINTARGALCDQEALANALETNRIFGAGLDVTDPEPILRDSPLLNLPNCLILPHIGSATRNSRAAMAHIAAENLKLGIEGKALRCPVP